MGVVTPLTTSAAAEPAKTEIPVCEPLRVPSAVVMLCVPAVLRVAVKVRTPASVEVNVVAAGSKAAPSVEEKDAVPRYPVATLFHGSSARTVNSPFVPALIGEENP